MQQLSNSVVLEVPAMLSLENSANRVHGTLKCVIFIFQGPGLLGFTKLTLSLRTDG